MEEAPQQSLDMSGGETGEPETEPTHPPTPADVSALASTAAGRAGVEIDWFTEHEVPFGD